jgi:hypothetical protein
MAIEEANNVPNIREWLFLECQVEEKAAFWANMQFFCLRPLSEALFGLNSHVAA